MPTTVKRSRVHRTRILCEGTCVLNGTGPDMQATIFHVLEEDLMHHILHTIVQQTSGMCWHTDSYKSAQNVFRFVTSCRYLYAFYANSESCRGLRREITIRFYHRCAPRCINTTYPAIAQDADKQLLKANLLHLQRCDSLAFCCTRPECIMRYPHCAFNCSMLRTDIRAASKHCVTPMVGGGINSRKVKLFSAACEADVMFAYGHHQIICLDAKNTNHRTLETLKGIPLRNLRVISLCARADGEAVVFVARLHDRDHLDETVVVDLLDSPPFYVAVWHVSTGCVTYVEDDIHPYNVVKYPQHVWWQQDSKAVSTVSIIGVWQTWAEQPGRAHVYQRFDNFLSHQGDAGIVMHPVQRGKITKSKASANGNVSIAVAVVPSTHDDSTLNAVLRIYIARRGACSCLQLYQNEPEGSVQVMCASISPMGDSVACMASTRDEVFIDLFAQTNLHEYSHTMRWCLSHNISTEKYASNYVCLTQRCFEMSACGSYLVVDIMDDKHLSRSNIKAFDLSPRRQHGRRVPIQVMSTRKSAVNSVLLCKSGAWVVKRSGIFFLEANVHEM